MTSPGNMDPTAHSAHLAEHIGVQPREPEFGYGTTQRVYEIQYGDYTFGINLGDITQVPTEAVMMPSTPWLGIGGGAIENALYGEIGDRVFDSYASMIQSSLRRAAELPEGEEKSAVKNSLANHFVVTTGMDRDNASKVAARLVGGSYMANLDPVEMQALVFGDDGITETTIRHEGRASIELEYGEAVPCPSGGLIDRGIKAAVIVNVTPTDGPGRESGMTSGHMAMFTRNAAQVAQQMGVRSLTIPAVGTGFAAAFGFGMSLQDSMRGFFDGARQFVDSGQAGELRRIDFNIYAQPTPESAAQAAEFVTSAGILHRLAA